MSGMGSRRAQPLNVPGIEENPAERKRVLNVLAQRRYRRRKREHLQKLEKSAQAEAPQQTSLQETPASPPAFSSPLPFDQFLNQPYFSCTIEEELFSAESTTVPVPILEAVPQDPDTSVCFAQNGLETLDTPFNFALSLLPTSPLGFDSLETTPPSDGMQSPDFSKDTSDQIYTFPDETYLPVLELNLLKGAMTIAKRLEVDSLVWSLDANSLFHNATALTYTHLPPNLRPSAVQSRFAHHPLLDILPWPSVRDRLITVFSQPEEFRPPSARSPTALVDLVYDLEDPVDGVRISGNDPCSGENWEVGEKLFKNWWWALDRRVLKRSNELRRNRGATMLGLDRNRDVQEID